MKTKLSINNGKYLVEIPMTLVELYSLKNGMIFEVKAKDVSKKTLLINFSTQTKR